MSCNKCGVKDTPIMHTTQHSESPTGWISYLICSNPHCEYNDLCWDTDCVGSEMDAIIEKEGNHE